MSLYYKLLLTFILISWNQILAQPTTFKNLLDLYSKGSSVTIDSSSANKFFGFTKTKFTGPLETGKVLFKVKNNIALTTKSSCFAGGYCYGSTVYTFTFGGELIDRAEYESGYGDCVFSNDRKNIFVSDTLLIFTHLYYEVEDCGDDENEVVIKDDLQLEYVYINQGKFETPIIRKINTRRKYYIGSSKFLNQAELKKYKTEELSIIRNEIFAAHGHIFSSVRWREYFTQQVWYKPLDNNVSHKLSMIEQHNIEILLEAEKNNEND